MKKKKVTSPNLFMKLVQVALMTKPETELKLSEILKLMFDYNWEVYELEDEVHSYQITGSHPIARRLDFYLTKTVIH